jgi:hypothetical protein
MGAIFGIPLKAITYWLGIALELSGSMIPSFFAQYRRNTTQTAGKMALLFFYHFLQRIQALRYTPRGFGWFYSNKHAFRFWSCVAWD